MWAKLMGLDTVSPEQLHAMLRDHREITVVDVNSRASWAASHVPGAVHGDPDNLEKLPVGKTCLLVFYCSNVFCTKAPRAARKARTIGYRSVMVMPTGLKGWLDAGLPTEGAV